MYCLSLLVSSSFFFFFPTPPSGGHILLIKIPHFGNHAYIYIYIYIYIYVSDFFCVTCFLLVLCCLCNVTFIYTSSLDFLKRGYRLTLADHWVCWCLLFLCNSNLFRCMADIFFFCKYLRQAAIKSPKRFSCEMFINQCATGMLISIIHLWLQLTIMRSIFVKDFSGRCHKGCYLWSTLASSLYFWADYCQYKWSLSSTTSFVFEKEGRPVLLCLLCNELIQLQMRYLLKLRNSANLFVLIYVWDKVFVLQKQ